MKHLLFPILLLCSLLSACSQALPDSPDTARISFQVGIPSTLTRSDDDALETETTMHTLHVYVYDDEQPNGLLESHFTFQPEAMTLDAIIKTGYGRKRFVFVANTDVREHWTFEDNDSSRDSFVMVSSATMDVQQANIDLGYHFLERLVSRVEICQIRNRMPSSVGIVRLKGIYLHNVARDLGNTSWEDDAYWRQDSDDLDVVRPLLDGGASGPFAPGSTWDAPAGGYYLYGYPNAAPQSADDRTRDWVTRLVVELEIDGVTSYYPIGIPDMESNRCYIIRRLDILRAGSPNPDHYVTTKDIDLEMQVADWIPAPAGSIDPGTFGHTDNEGNTTL